MNAKALEHGWYRAAVPGLALSAFTIGVAAFARRRSTPLEKGMSERSPRSRTGMCPAPQQRSRIDPGNSSLYGYVSGTFGSYDPDTPGSYKYGPGMPWNSYGLNSR